MRLVFLDITATHEDREALIYRCSLPHGRTGVHSLNRRVAGFNSLENIKNLLRAGADKISINSAAVRNPDFINASQRSLWQSVYCCGDRRQAEARILRILGWDVYVRGGTGKHRT
jgi:cyclase